MHVQPKPCRGHRPAALSPASARPRTHAWLFRLLAGLLACLGTSCAPPEPVRVGFLGGLSGSMAIVGIGAHDGALLAIEQANRNGGLDGRPIELLAQDDAQDPAQALRALHALQQAGVDAVIGPTTTAMAERVVVPAGEARMLLLSPTVTGSQFDQREDALFRLMSSARLYAERSARYHALTTGVRRVVAFYDRSNAAFTEDWLNHFDAELARHQGRILARHGFLLLEGNLGQLVEQALAQQPDALLVVAGAVDAAQLAQQLRKRDVRLPLIGAESTASEELLRLGGSAVEGMYLAQFIDRESTDPAYLAFVDSFQQRFGRRPGFVELAGFDSANALLLALAQRRPDESLAAALQRLSPMQGVQHPVGFDRYGDALRDTHITRIRDGRFTVLD